MLTERYGIAADQACDLLRTLSQDSNVTLAQSAQQIVAADAEGTAPAPEG
ncbi:UNVERIFIED_CONTAM: ANTAR domain-containing protein [Williamsia faeni]